MRNYNRKRKPKHSAKSGYKLDFGGRLVFVYNSSKTQNIVGYFTKDNYKSIKYLGKVVFYVNEVMKWKRNYSAFTTSKTTYKHL